MQKRVDRLEQSLGNVTMKIDNVLTKLDSMEKSKQKRRETMSKIMNTITENDAGKYTVLLFHVYTHFL